jgi:glycosyltransferase involved in cell wall biosynthesis
VAAPAPGALDLPTDAPVGAVEHGQRGALPPRSRLCFVADGRSPITRNWVRHFVERGDEVHLVSTFPCEAGDLRLASLSVIPVAFGSLAGGRGRSAPGAGRARGPLERWRGRLRAAAHAPVFGWVAPWEMRRHVARARALIQEIDPLLVHAMRIPYEGMLAAASLRESGRPLVVSVWGNDLELWAARYPLLGRLTKEVLRRATALHPDCARDLSLARAWGWDGARPAAVLPSNGGVRGSVFRPGAPDAALLARYGLPRDAAIVLNARGFRSYVRNDTFFRAMHAVRAGHPEVLFVGVGMQDNPQARRWVEEFGVADCVRLLPSVPPADMAGLLRAASVAVSPSEFDGTPNTLLETMACGALPVAGDIASVREWITDGTNGLLFDPRDPGALAAALARALSDHGLRRSAAAHNRAIVAERAEYETSMRRAETLYVDAVKAARTADRR